jgi:PKD repeat protein
VGTAPPARTYQTAGPRSVSLRVTDSSGEAVVVPKSFRVGSNIRPEASFRFSPRNPKVGEQIEFTSTSDDADDRIAKHEWDFNRDGRYDAQGRVVTRSFSGPGRKLVVLRVTDSRGAVETSSQTVSVQRKTLKSPVDVKRSLGYIREDWGVRLVVLYVKVPARTTVKVTCKGRGCPSGTFTKRSKAKRAKLRFDKLRGSVRAGAKITVISTRKGHVPAYDTYLVRAGNRSPLLREGCKPPGSKRVRALSSCSS